MSIVGGKATNTARRPTIASIDGVILSEIVLATRITRVRWERLKDEVKLKDEEHHDLEKRVRLQQVFKASREEK